nr:Panacea domain-containing protein [uncultured Prevotella sp.]
MDRYNKERLVEIVLYVLNKTGELDYHTLLKTIYFAELKHLAKWGQRMTEDDVCAMPYGPVLSHLLDAIKGDSHERELSQMLRTAFKFASEDASNIMLPLRKANEDYLSESEKEALDASI